MAIMTRTPFKKKVDRKFQGFGRKSVVDPVSCQLVLILGLWRILLLVKNLFVIQDVSLAETAILCMPKCTNEETSVDPSDESTRVLTISRRIESICSAVPLS
jgi:hypothetical protein